MLQYHQVENPDNEKVMDDDDKLIIKNNTPDEISKQHESNKKNENDPKNK